MSEATIAAIDAAVRAHSIEEWDGDLPIDWVVVAGLTNTDNENAIGVTTSRSPIPNYVTVGLLHEGIRVVNPDNA